jgi:hypothetical protein
MGAICVVNSIQKSLHDQLTFPQLVNKFQETATCPYLELHFPVQTHFSVFHCLVRAKGSLLVRGFVEHVIKFFFTERSLLASRSTSKLQDHPLSTMRDCLHIFTATLHIWWAGTAQYSDWLRAGRSGDRISVGQVFPHPSSLGLGPIQLTVQWVPGFFSRDKPAGAWRWLTTPSSGHVKERVELYLWISVLSSRVNFTFSPSIFAVRYFTRNTRKRHAVLTETHKLWRSRWHWILKWTREKLKCGMEE